MSLVFVDESGCTGFRFEAGSTAYFTVTLVIFEERSAAEECDKAIAEFKRASRRTREYRFSGCNEATKERFFEFVRDFGFVYHSIVVNKAALYGPGFKFSESLIKSALRYVLINARDYLNNSIVVYDENGDKHFRRTVQTYLKRQLRAPDGKKSLIKKVKCDPSHRNNLIQLADMVCGAVASSFAAKKNRNRFRKLISRKETGVQFWPKKNPSPSRT